MKVGDLVVTEYYCGTTTETGCYNINGSTFVRGTITKIKNDGCWIEIVDPAHSNLQVGEVIYTLVDQCWKLGPSLELD